MPQQPIASIQNNFTKGLVTEFTGLNFPENAATDTDNVAFSIVGNVTRRLGIDKEVNGVNLVVTQLNNAISSYKWNNVGGDGLTQIVCEQVGNTLYFYKSSNATLAAPLSTTKLAATVNIASFVASGGSFNTASECQFADGNGYLFVFHPNCDPFYCTYNPAGSVITATAITINVRDFIGIAEAGVADTTRPSSLSDVHQYNLINQGWTNTPTWQADSTTLVPYASLVSPTNVNNTFTVQAGLPVVAGTAVLMQATITDAGGGHFIPRMTGVVISYGGTTLVVNTNPIGYVGSSVIISEQWAITPLNTGGQIGTWNAQIGNYPSNSDVWWNFKNSTGTFDPTNTVGNISLSTAAPKGSSILNVFNQNRNALVGSVVLTPITTVKRPTIGTWFQGRIWYAGVNAQQPAVGNAPYYSWTENIYFSQIIKGIADFGKCHQQNDPASETLFDLLPTDGGVIQIQGCGSVYKLFPIQNGMLVFASNGIWFITGSQGIGFTANDYTITKISSVQSIGSNSFVNVLGLPYFWNEEGIYTVTPSKNGGLEVNPITIGTILSFYEAIPLSCKKLVKGDYDPVNYIIQWIYRDTEASTTAEAYAFNKILNFNTYNKAFFPYTVNPVESSTSINSITYVVGPGGSNSPSPGFKYFSSTQLFGSFLFTFADEHDTTYADWTSVTGGTDYLSYFVTGYQIRGQAQKTFFPGYVWMFSTSSATTNTAYKFNSIWDYASNGDSGRWSSERLVTIPPVNYSLYYRRHKLRGHGLALQFKVQSVTGKNFDIIGWTSSDNVNTGI